ncbi:hypothetical protein Pint_31769 [Pistacia integerrima]|uniref:Uncharacterized protein n=1 Tax=Pistacia integerrima TaxID=434235 RepID=A0ACC0XSF1_9ROSI|nr:hypothetical protein Pint_31769 [Pistacia integerrima]
MDNPSRPVTGYPAPNQNGHPHPPPNAAYPYAAAPPPSQPYAYNPYYQAQTPIYRRPAFVRSFLITMIALAIIFGCILFIFWLVVRPRVPEFHVTSLSVSNFSTNNSQLTANWDARVQAYNPNKKMSVYYYDVFSAINYNSVTLSRTQMPPFEQGTRNQTELTAKFAVVGSYIEEKAVNSINSERSGGSVKFDFRLEAYARFKYGAWRMRRKWARVWCDDVAVSLSSSSGSGNLVGGSKKCRVAI